uniref:Uncharacterized protein n=1 Tax=Anguilla anguilla TaxID=7936 RepID=A0A0E9T0Y0_ANGAN
MSLNLVQNSRMLFLKKQT